MNGNLLGGKMFSPFVTEVPYGIGGPRHGLVPIGT
jgi:hypothetical protein